MTFRSDGGADAPAMHVSLRVTARCEAPEASAHWVEEDGIARIVAPRPAAPAVGALKRWLERSGFDVVDVRARGRSCRITANGAWSPRDAPMAAPGERVGGDG